MVVRKGLIVLFFTKDGPSDGSPAIVIKLRGNGVVHLQVFHEDGTIQPQFHVEHNNGLNDQFWDWMKS